MLFIQAYEKLLQTIKMMLFIQGCEKLLQTIQMLLLNSGIWNKTDVERRQTLGHPRSINPNMINHVPQQSPLIF